jgi:hypothetical protein
MLLLATSAHRSHPESFRRLSLHKGNLSLTTTLGRLNADSATVNVIGVQLKHFPDFHPSPGHLFQDEPVSLILCPKDGLVYGFPFHDLPRYGPVVFEDLPKHWGITGICEPLRARVYDKGEEGAKKGKAESLGGLLESLGQVTKKVRIFSGVRDEPSETTNPRDIVH